METIRESSAGVLPELAAIRGHKAPGHPEPRQVEVYICCPQGGINENTGIMLVSHNWGGTWQTCAPWCGVIADKFNLITLDVNYWQSGWKRGDAPYDFGVIQSMDCLLALREVRQHLTKRGIPFNRRRTYASGASGGGNVSQMLNKLAPRSFGCVIDLCGPVLTWDVALGRGALDAGYSADPAAANYLTPAMMEIRDFGNPAHLAIQYRYNPEAQVVIVHALGDEACPCADKAGVFANMLRAGFKPAAFFVTPVMADGIIVTGCDHQIGDRAYVISQFGKPYISEHGEFVRQLTAPDDFERGETVVYPVTGGEYRIDYSAGAPELSFVRI